ncbi:MAG: FtsW/RodA/SpoVE family cell cycle protein, partial [Enterococcus faecalis]|nr:FtsW/RodA/SpoVE family cell cycle protein [Enterococcus faecalis]
AILILVIGSVLIFSASIHAKFSVIAAGIVVASAALLSKIIIFLGDHRYLPHFFAHVYDRLVVLKNPFLSFHDRGFQPSMAYLAMYNGGFWGTGLANGMVKKGGLPEGQTDFIFAVIVEELGLIGGLLLLFLLLFLAASILRSSCVIKNHCYGLFLLGVGTLILAQTAINIGGVLGLIPMTGIPLPFVSYGGTSYLIFSVALGIVIKIIANERRQLNGQYKKIQLTS